MLKAAVRQQEAQSQSQSRAVMTYFVLATTATFIVAMATGAAAVAQNEWFGASDLLPFAIYSTIFALLAAPASVLAYRSTKRLPVWVAAVVAFLVGLLYGFLGTLAVALFLDPWMGAMSVPILQSWCVAAAFTFTSAVLLWRLPFSRPLVLGLAGIAFASAGGAFAFQPALSLALGNQHLAVYFYRHIPGNNELDLSEVVGDLEPVDIQLLRQTGLRGRLENRGYFASNSTEWPRAKALLVFTAATVSNATLPQPKRCTIAYVQDGSGFRRVPQDAATLERSMRIESGSTGPQLSVEDASGSRSGGSIDP